MFNVFGKKLKVFFSFWKEMFLSVPLTWVHVVQVLRRRYPTGRHLKIQRSKSPALFAFAFRKIRKQKFAVVRAAIFFTKSPQLAFNNWPHWHILAHWRAIVSLKRWLASIYKSFAVAILMNQWKHVPVVDLGAQVHCAYCNCKQIVYFTSSFWVKCGWWVRRFANFLQIDI